MALIQVVASWVREMSLQTRIHLASGIAAAIAALCWFKVAMIATPETVSATFDGGGPLQELADALTVQAKWNAYGAGAATIAALLQVIGASIRSK